MFDLYLFFYLKRYFSDIYKLLDLKIYCFYIFSAYIFYICFTMQCRDNQSAPRKRDNNICEYQFNILFLSCKIRIMHQIHFLTFIFNYANQLKTFKHAFYH